ncbi:MAG TPA: NAD(P)-dependent oxidoreductase [Planctomycetaceae bacterium]|jgi:3-oxoacyl-[acyl-carrier protein] reductase|nr:NAD(P)-dependent oxidoreductase [Planctomycetaceae bacterium]HBC59828.1 NAD(P)-dependent oxidoreductase [Planctomycetaceae bacterium]
MKTLAGRTAFLTGAAAGIGRALARALAAAGCHLFLVDRDADGLQRLQDELSGSGVTVRSVVCDLADAVSVDRVVMRALEQTGGIDLLINNAGVCCYGPTDQMTQAQWDWLMSINLLSPIRITQALLPHLLLREDPHIVNMCSISGLVAGGRLAAYHTSKFGLVGYTEALRAEYGRRGVGVTAICPGPVRTNLYDSGQSLRDGTRVPLPPAWLCATAEQVAAATVRGILGDRRRVLVTPMAHGLSMLSRLAPWLIDFANRFSRNGRRRRLEQVRAEQRRQAEQQEIRKAG